MEAFSLLKYWRGGGGGRGGVAVDGGANVRSAGIGTTTIVTAVSHHVSETDDDDDDDDGPFFDLEFALPDDDDDDGGGGGDDQPKHEDSDCAEEGDDDREEAEEIESNGTEGENEEREFKFTLSSGSSSDRNDPNVSLSPSDDLFFKGRLVPVEPSSMNFNDSESNAAKSQFSLLKSATKFRVMMLKFKKSKANVIEKTEPNGSASATPKQQQQQKAEEPKQNQNQTQSKFLTVKFKVEEVPIMSLFTRDNSSRATNKSQKQQCSDESASYEKRFSKDVMQRYLKKVKPLYVRVSKRYGEKLRFSGQLSFGSSGGTKTEPSPPTNSPPAKSTAAKSESEPSELTEPPPPPPPPSTGIAKSQKQGNLPAGLRVVCKHLGKSRSASSAASPSGSIQSKRRDDSLLQQQDGIQSAILHCKRSFNASRDSDSSLLSRSVSDSLHEKSSHLSKKCLEELKGTGGVGCV